MDYQEKQKKVFREMEKAFKEGKSRATIVEMMANYADDNQICLTTVVFIPKYLRERIQERIIKPLKKTGPAQYFYPLQSLHITIQGIRIVHRPPLFTKDDIEKVKKAFSRIIPQYSPINFEIKGILELPTSLSLKAFSDKKFHDLVMVLRKTLDQIGLPDDKAYFSKNVVLGNISFCRYTRKPNELFQKKVKEFKNVEIGKINADKVHLITTNAVCHSNKTDIIKTFNLRKK